MCLSVLELTCAFPNRMSSTVTWTSWRWLVWTSRWTMPWSGWTARWTSRTVRTSLWSQWSRFKRSRPRWRYSQVDRGNTSEGKTFRCLCSSKKCWRHTPAAESLQPHTNQRDVLRDFCVPACYWALKQRQQRLLTACVPLHRYLKTRKWN